MDGYKVNLLPKHLQREGKTVIRRLVSTLAALLFTVVILGGYIIFLVNYTVVKNELSETKSQAALLAPAAARVTGIISERAELEAAIAEFDQVLQNRRSWSGLLHDLGDIAPVDLWLTGLEIVDKPFHTLPDNNQKAPDPYAPPRLVSCRGMTRTPASVGVFLRNLIGLPYFTEVRLVKVNAVSEGLEFEIIARVKDEV